LYFTLKKLLPRKFALEEPIGRSRHTRDDNIEMNPRYVGCDVMDLVEVPENKSPVVITVVIKLLEILVATNYRISKEDLGVSLNTLSRI
jgi:hypothetical protein